MRKPNLTLPIGLGVLVFLGICPGAWPATMLVTSSLDSGPNTLRAAVAASNTTSATTNTIVFSIANSITINSSLNVVHPVVIEGGFNTIGAVSNAQVIFWFATGSDGSTVKNLALINSGTGLFLTSSNNRVLGCAVGVDWAGTTYCGNTYGIDIHGSNNDIGGSTPAERNVISGNSMGIYTAGGGVQQTRIRGNYIGTGFAGATFLPNVYGVYLENGSNQVTVGGNSINGEGNVISGNMFGCYFGGANTFGNTLCGNIIGLRADQNGTVANTSNGIIIYGASGNWVGLPQAGGGNVVAGNLSRGIYLDGGADSNVIQNNTVGLNAAGVAFTNNYGIWIGTSNHNLIGGRRADALFERNTIAGNGMCNLYLAGYGNTVSGNYLGLNPAGMASGGGWHGLDIFGEGNLIGGGGAGRGNIISGNGGPGLMDSGSGNSIVGNWIGLNAAGTGVVANNAGVLLNGHHTRFGGTNAGEGNVISGNSSGMMLVGGTGHVIYGNYFGTNAAGTGFLANTGVDVDIASDYGCLIGGTAPGARNVICTTGGYEAIRLEGNAFGNTVAGNFINVFSDGNWCGQNAPSGIHVIGTCHGNFIGYRGAGLGNLIAGCDAGILLDTVSQNGLFGNTICAFANTQTGEGIVLSMGANGNHAAPVISVKAANYLAGTAAPGDYIECFKADRVGGYHGGSLRFLGSTTANAGGAWSVWLVGLSAGDFVCGTATDANLNTSAFSLNQQVSGALPTPTATATSTVTMTPTITPTATVTPTANNSLANVDLGGRTVLAFPNPAKGKVRFLMHLDQPVMVKIAIYNMLGEKVAMLDAGLLSGRGQAVTWDCPHAGAGIYVARVFQQNQEVAKIKFAVVR